MPKHFAEVLVLMNGQFSASQDEVSSYVWCESDWKLDLSNSEIDVSTQFHTLPFEKFLFSFQDHTEKLENLHSSGMDLFHCHPASTGQDLLSHKWLCQISRKGYRAGYSCILSHLSL